MASRSSSIECCTNAEEAMPTLLTKRSSFSALRRPHWFLLRPLDGRSCRSPAGHIDYPTDIVPSLREEIDTATKLFDKACQKLRGIPDVPPQRITDLKNVTRQLCQLSCILDSCTMSASYEVCQAQKTLLVLMPRTAQGASTSSEEFSAQLSLPTDEEEPNHQDQLQKH